MEARRHIHLDPVGGIAGDMFIAALIDARPGLYDPMIADIRAAGVPDQVSFEVAQADTAGMRARRFAVRIQGRPRAATTRYPEIVAMLDRSLLAADVREAATGILALLAAAEGRVHGIDSAEVHFHELADWDSIADVVGAASLVTRLGPATWTCASLPLGRGTVRTAHGRLPVPAPATVELLKGFAFHDDGEKGERVTPTGAAILRFLMARNDEGIAPGVLAEVGVGAGAARFGAVPNILRALVFEPGAAFGDERVAEIAFDVDDMTPEEMATALDRIRALEGVLDAAHGVRHGKKGRVQFAVRILARPHERRRVIEHCLNETSTIGLCWTELNRSVLAREIKAVEDEDGPVRVKVVRRPDGRRTGKAESDDVTARAGLGERRRARRRAVSGAVEGDDGSS